MSHIAHPDVHKYGLYDGCAECESSADNPWALLDDEALRQCLRLAAHGGKLRSQTEAAAVRSIATTLSRTGRLAKLDPEAVLAALRPWGVVGELSVAQPPASAETGGDGVGTGEAG